MAAEAGRPADRMGYQAGALLGVDQLVGAVGSMAEDSPLWDSCNYVVSSPGKRFRASVLIDAAQYGSHPDDPLVERAAIAVELFHAATLAHDDVVDDGRLRRGKPTIGAHAGNLAASLSGGWLFGRAVELVAEVGDEAVVRFGEAATSVCEGEMLETRELHDPNRTRERYLQAVEAKTASLIAFAGWLGAKAGGASDEDVERLDRYGEAVGMAFQIVDDVLDLIADPEVTGKSAGSDLRQGVYTLPVIYALEEDPSLREALRRGPEREELPELVERVRATKAIEATIAEGREWIERARSSLPGLECPAGHAERLASLAAAVAGQVQQLR